jgi:broad specificity phosphatase PhoE
VRALLLLALILTVGTAAASRLAETSTTIVLVRHGEKALEPADDPPLNPAGEARAAALVEVLRSAGITAIYSTPWKRTQQTARPIAEKLGIPVTTFDVRPGERGYGEMYAAELLAKQRGRVVLVVGHSNTVPSILRGLGVTDAAAIADTEYDNLFVVTLPETGPVRVLRARFGAH